MRRDSCRIPNARYTIRYSGDITTAFGGFVHSGTSGLVGCVGCLGRLGRFTSPTFFSAEASTHINQCSSSGNRFTRHSYVIEDASSLSPRVSSPVEYRVRGGIVVCV
ncbi:Hypothetical predicted protein [Drosophila guanche]|uniref:Uncharacterized protein n=1 Tax=Drosophila guanche TaxID=7266 RepID=A0A3B0JZI6_DROGU|nr:Hypothetical predicted protein [Drosophila guanche]